MKRILILEDNDERIELFSKNFLNCELCIVKHVDACIEKLKTEKWWGLFLDHDLNGNMYVFSGGEEETGYDVAKFLNENPEFTPEYVATHSLNESGRIKILGQIGAHETLFVWQKIVDFNEI